MTQRAGLYARISKFDGEGQSPGAVRQLADTSKLAASRGWEIADTYIDDDVSAYSGKPRPSYLRMLEDIEQGRIDAVVVWHADRLHRSPRELEDFVDLVNRTHAVVASVTSGDVDLESSHGLATARIMGVVARMESDDKSRRLKRMHAERVANGLPNGGGRPYGFEPDRVTHRPAEVAVVVEVVERIARGETLTRVAQLLNERGVPAARGGHWSIANIRRLVLNARYIGHRTHHGNDVGPAVWEPMVDEGSWRRAGAMLSDPSRPKRRSSRKYLLSGGLLTCGGCGAAMRSKQYHGGRGGKVPTYACPPRALGGCGGVSARAEAVEQLVANAVIEIVESARFAKAMRAGRGGDRRAAADIERIHGELAHFADAMGAGSLSVREYERIRAGAMARLAEAEARMSNDTAHSALARFAGQAGALEAAWTIKDRPMPLDERQAIVRAAVGSIVIAPVGRASGNRFNDDRVQVVPAF